MAAPSEEISSPKTLRYEYMTGHSEKANQLLGGALHVCNPIRVWERAATGVVARMRVIARGAV